MRGMLRVGSVILQGALLGGLAVWTAAAPLCWILRDGLAAGMVETTGWRAVGKFLGLWGLPALALATPLAALWLLSRPRGSEVLTEDIQQAADAGS